MTSSERTTLRAEDVERLAARVGTCHRGEEASGASVAFVCARFNGGLTAALLDGALDALAARGTDPATVTVAWVPGAFEAPLAAQRIARSGAVDAVVALGAVIRGDTPHFDCVAGECASGLARVGLDTGVPVVFGVLTCDTEAQAWERAGPGAANKGAEAAVTALEMVSLLDRLPKPAAS